MSKIKKLIFATQNKGKIIEMRDILRDLDIEILSAAEAGITEDVVEDGKTFEENALKKARFVAEKTGEWTVADDSGLCIESLGGAPGVYSARWGGKTPESFQEKTIESLKGDDNRRAWFETSLVLVEPNGKHWTFTGKIYGTIPEEIRGKSLPGLPYDSVFVPDGYEITFAEMSASEKNNISHRGLAFRHLKDFLKSN